MKIILRADVPKLGRRGDVKEVADGFGRNHLIAQGLAEIATPEALRAREAELQNRQIRDAAERERFIQLAERLRPLELRFTMKQATGGQPFGSVSAQDIVNAAREKGMTIEKSWLKLDHPLKTTGQHSIELVFPHQVPGKLSVIIVGQE